MSGGSFRRSWSGAQSQNKVPYQGRLEGTPHPVPAHREREIFLIDWAQENQVVFTSQTLSWAVTFDLCVGSDPTGDR